MDPKRELRGLRRDMDKLLGGFSKVMSKGNREELEEAGVDRPGLQKIWNALTSTSMDMRSVAASEMDEDSAIRELRAAAKLMEGAGI